MSWTRRTKIVGTLGPRSSLPAVLGPLVQAGLDVARLNCSHASHGDLAVQVEMVDRVARLQGRAVATLLDLSGPKVRTGRLVGGSMELRAGASVRVVPGDAPGQDDWISSNHAGLPEDVSAGDRILLDDGKMELLVLRVDGERVVHTEVVVAGLLKERKGMNLPDRTVSIPAMTEKDKADLAVGLDLSVDYVALSFVQTADDIRMLKQQMGRHGGKARIIAKIEKPQAVQDIDAILGEVDGIMVARGDLAVEVGNHRVPLMQKELLRRSNRRGTLDIVATQMLESMTTNPRPTRAEASDVANAILDGCDAVMLSGETATGDYPVEAVKMMDLIAREVEPAMGSTDHLHLVGLPDDDTAITVAVAQAAARLSALPRIRALVVFTLSGRTAQVLSAFYPRTRIFALTPHPETCRALALVRGVTPLEMRFPGNSDQMVHEGEALLVERGLLRPGDEAVVVAGFTQLRGVANMVKVVRV